MRLLLGLGFLLSAGVAAAQDGIYSPEGAYYYYFDPYAYGSNEPYMRLFADDVIVRSDTSRNSAVIATLPIGYPVQIQEAASSPKKLLWNYPAPWYEVRFKYPGTWPESRDFEIDSDSMAYGYIWGGLLGWTSYPLDDGAWLVSGPMAGKGTYGGQIKVVKNGKLLSSAPVAPVDVLSVGGEFTMYEAFSEKGTIQFQGNPQVILVSSAAVGCSHGMWNETQYLFYQNGKLIPGFTSEFNYQEGVWQQIEIEWPTDSTGTPNQIKLTHTTTPWEEETGEVTRSESLYLWDGKRLKTVYENKPVPLE